MREVDVSDLTGGAGGAATEQLAVYEPGAQAFRRFTLVGVEGVASGQRWESTADRCAIGSHASNDLALDDPSVSRFHCEILLEARGARLRDLASRNGTTVDGLQVTDAWLRDGSVVRLGRSALRFTLSPESNRVPVSAAEAFGSLVGRSPAMRATFALLERAAASDATVLLEGETGTGKEGAAESLHRAGARKDGPFVVLDCSAIPPDLLESELFGHEKGAFTGAHARRIGVFEEAHGGTVFLDEIGELDPELQPKLLRVLERREVRRVGANVARPVDVRVVAATNRDLRGEVNAGRFRADLYFRLAVVRVPLPPLRQRPEDIPLLVARLLDGLGADDAARARLGTPAFQAALLRAAWPGNVRELRNHLERCLVLDDAAPPVPSPMASIDPQAPAAGVGIDPTVSYTEARRRALDEFERRYIEALLALHGGRVTQAARASGIDRVYLYKLMHRHGLRR